MNKLGNEARPYIVQNSKSAENQNSKIFQNPKAAKKLVEQYHSSLLKAAEARETRLKCEAEVVQLNELHISLQEQHKSFQEQHKSFQEQHKSLQSEHKSLQMELKKNNAVIEKKQKNLAIYQEGVKRKKAELTQKQAGLNQIKSQLTQEQQEAAAKAREAASKIVKMFVVRIFFANIKDKNAVLQSTEDFLKGNDCYKGPISCNRETSNIELSKEAIKSIGNILLNNQNWQTLDISAARGPVDAVALKDLLNNTANIEKVILGRGHEVLQKDLLASKKWHVSINEK